MDAGSMLPRSSRSRWLALAVLLAHRGCAGLTVTEFNPDHGEPDGSTARTFARALATALAGRPS